MTLEVRNHGPAAVDELKASVLFPGAIEAPDGSCLVDHFVQGFKSAIAPVGAIEPGVTKTITVTELVLGADPDGDQPRTEDQPYNQIAIVGGGGRGTPARCSTAVLRTTSSTTGNAGEGSGWSWRHHDRPAVFDQ